MVGRPSQRSGSSREALSEGWEWSGGPPKGLGDPPGGSRGPPGGQGMVERPSRRAESGWEAIP